MSEAIAEAALAPKDSRLRSFAKALSWRVVATITTTTLTYLYTGAIDTALLVGGTEFVLKFFIYYFHERAWEMVPRRSAA